MMRLVSSSESSPSCDFRSSVMPWPVDLDLKNFKKLKVPKVPAKTLQEIGRFMVLWGVLELQLDTLVSVIFRTDATLGLTLTAGLNTKAKLEILRSSFNMLRDPLGGEFVDEADDLFVEIATLANGTRNVIAHGQMIDGSGLEYDTPVIARFSARKQLELRTYPIEPEIWREQCVYAEDIARTLRGMIPHIVKSIKDLTAEDYDRICIGR